VCEHKCWAGTTGVGVEDVGVPASCVRHPWHSFAAVIFAATTHTRRRPGTEEGGGLASQK
jgi:hypothetical protein